MNALRTLHIFLILNDESCEWLFECKFPSDSLIHENIVLKENLIKWNIQNNSE